MRKLSPVSWLVGPSVTNTFRFPGVRVSERLQTFRRPRGMIYFPKAMTNSFQTLISKVYSPKCIFAKCILRGVSVLCNKALWANCIFTQPSSTQPTQIVQLISVATRLFLSWLFWHVRANPRPRHLHLITLHTAAAAFSDNHMSFELTKEGDHAHQTFVFFNIHTALYIRGRCTSKM